MKGKRREGKDEGSGKWSAPGPALALGGPADTCLGFATFGIGVMTACFQ